MHVQFVNKYYTRTGNITESDCSTGSLWQDNILLKNCPMVKVILRKMLCEILARIAKITRMFFQTTLILNRFVPPGRAEFLPLHLAALSASARNLMCIPLDNHSFSFLTVYVRL